MAMITKNLKSLIPHLLQSVHSVSFPTVPTEIYLRKKIWKELNSAVETWNVHIATL
jgi:hypothetical protein